MPTNRPTPAEAIASLNDLLRDHVPLRARRLAGNDDTYGVWIQWAREYLPHDIAEDHARVLMTRDSELPGELDIDIEAARNAVGVIVEIPGTGALGVVVGCCVAARDGEDVWTARDEYGSWHECRAGDARVLGRVDDTGRIDWEI
jgi:hypothetical protein